MDLVEAQAGGFEQPSRHPWERARLALAARLIRAHVRPADGDLVIDIGCGDTFVVEALAREYPRTQFYAVDSAFTPELMAKLRSRMGVPNVTLFASLDDVPRTRPAALILLMDVLEHVSDDRGMLSAIARGPLVSRATRFLITVPAYAALFCAHDRFLGHYRRYSLSSLHALVRAGGLAPLHSGLFFTTLLPIRLLQVLVERLVPSAREGASGLATWRGREFTARVLALVLEWDGRAALALLAAGVRVPGLSTFAICRTSA